MIKMDLMNGWTIASFMLAVCTESFCKNNLTLKDLKIN